MGTRPHLKLVCGIVPSVAKTGKIDDPRFRLTRSLDDIWESQPVPAPVTFEEDFVVNHFIDRWNLSKVKGRMPEVDDIRYFDEFLYFETSPNPLFGVVFDEAHGDLVWTMCHMFNGNDSAMGNWGTGKVMQCPSVPLEDDWTEYGVTCRNFFKYGRENIPGPCTIWHLPTLKRQLDKEKRGWKVMYMLEKLRLIQHEQNYTWLGSGFAYNFTITHFLMSQIGWVGLTKYDYRMFLSLTWS